MKSKNLFLFAIIFLINTNIFVFSDDYGYILINFIDESEMDLGDYLTKEDATIECRDLNFNISFLTDYKDFSSFFLILLKFLQT